MPKTAVTSSEITNNRFNPYITKGINKSLLTPCRQVGLSRKRKTPSSDKSLDKSNSNLQGSTQTKDVTTPLTSKVLPVEGSCSKADVISESKVVKLDKKKSSVSKCLMPDEKNNVKVHPLEMTILNDNVTPENFHAKKIIHHKTQKTKEKDKKTKDKSSRKDKHSSKISIEKELKVEDKLTKSHEECVKTKTVLTESKEENIKILKVIQNGNTEKAPVSQETLTESKETKKDLQKSPKLKDASKYINSLLMDHDYILPPKKNTKLKRSLSLKKSSQEFDSKKSVHQEENDSSDVKSKHCSVVLTPLELENTNDEIKCLQKQVEDKRKLVENLKQAEIYKKLHDVNKLKELTTTWKSGCISALNDLLPHLQRHGDIDMATLLNNLRVPEKLITLSENGDLI